MALALQCAKEAKMSLAFSHSRYVIHGDDEFAKLRDLLAFVPYVPSHLTRLRVLRALIFTCLICAPYSRTFNCDEVFY